MLKSALESEEVIQVPRVQPDNIAIITSGKQSLNKRALPGNHIQLSPGPGGMILAIEIMTLDFEGLVY